MRLPPLLLPQVEDGEEVDEDTEAVGAQVVSGVVWRLQMLTRTPRQ